MRIRKGNVSGVKKELILGWLLTAGAAAASLSDSPLPERLSPPSSRRFPPSANHIPAVETQ